MPMPYNVDRVLPYFYRRINAYDLISAIDGYRTSQVKGEPYTFIGVLIPPTDKDLELFDEGEIAQGAMTLYVKSTVKLYMGDAIPSKDAEWRQTIVVYDGDEYRVKSYSNRSVDGNHRKYGLVRYVPGRSGAVANSIS